MENPADVYTTGIPMSEKGNFDHNKYGCDDGDTVDIVSVIKLADHDYPNNSHIVLRDSSCDNVEYINNSIQDGFQSEILCRFVCGTGLQSDLPMADSSPLEMESVSETDTHITFSDSPGTSFPGKIESFSSMEGLVTSLDEQLDSYLLSGFKEENKTPSEDGNQSVEEEQRNVTEAICDIAKSFGLEDLLPETFQVDGNKDGLCVTVTTDDLCSEDNENSELKRLLLMPSCENGELSLEDFEKCSELHSPASSLNLVEHLEDNYAFTSLDMLSSRNKLFDSCINSRIPQLLKEDQNKIFLNSKGDLIGSEVVDVHLETDDGQEVDLNNSEIVESVQSAEDIKYEYLNEENVTDLVSDIPTVSISDVQIENSFTELDQNCPPAGSVLIKTDKASKKMQIVLTLQQGQQIYDIDTDSVDASQQPIDLDFPSSFSDDKLQDVQNSMNDDFCDVEQLQDSSAMEEDKSSDFSEEAPVEKIPIVEFVSSVPTGKVKKSKTWVCPIDGCGQVLDKECKLRVHMISHKGARPFKCTFDGCDWAFTTPYRLRRHVETHLGSKDYVCDFEGCNRKFTTVYNLKTHKKRHKWPNSLTCPSKDCKMSFANRRKLELHLRVHEDVEAPYKCSMCGKQYYSANCIASHYRTHQYNEDDFKCPFQGCGKVYDKICRLKQHMRHHTGDRPYTCPADGCKWSFMSASKLTRHMRKHTGERKFVCTEPGCGKSFMRPEHLKGHVVIHSGDKPFHCPHENCNARFTAKSSLYVHVKKHCPSVLKVVYACPVEPCTKRYNSKATLKQHMQKLHPEMFKDGKQIDIAEKFQLTMPVSVVSGSSEALEFLDFDDMIADDPTFLRMQLFPNEQQSSISSPVLLNSEQSTVGSSDLTCKTVPKSSKIKILQNQAVQSSAKETAKSQKTKKTSSKPSKLIRVKKSGCARTDYCSNYVVKKSEPQTSSFIYLNQNSSDTDTKGYLVNNQLRTDIKSPDLMLTSSSIYHDNPSEQLIKSHFSPDNSSTSHSLYADDSLLVSSGAFGTELIPVSLLSDGVDSDDSVLNSDSGIVFSEQNGVDAFSESIHLHGLD